MATSCPDERAVQRCREMLAQFNACEPIDDAEEILDNIPMYLEWIIAQHEALKERQ